MNYYLIAPIIIAVPFVYRLGRLYKAWRWGKKVQLNTWVRVQRHGFDFSKTYLVIAVRLNEVMVSDKGGEERGRWVPRRELRPVN